MGTQFDPAGTPNPDQMMVASANLAEFRNLKSQSIVWIRDGELIAENGVTPTNGRYTLTATSTVIGGLGQWRTVLVITGFQASDIGVYQVIFTDSDQFIFHNIVFGGSVVLTTTPVRLDTGEHVCIAAVILIIQLCKWSCYQFSGDAETWSSYCCHNVASGCPESPPPCPSLRVET